MTLRPRSHYSVFVQKRREKPPFLWKCSRWSAQKRHKNGGFRKRCQKWISTKTEVFENAVDQCEHTKTEVFENAVDQCEHTKTEVFENAPVSNNELHKNGVMWTHKNGCFSLRFCYRADQCERIKTEVFLTVFVRKRSRVNGSFDATKTDTNKNGVVWTGPQALCTCNGIQMKVQLLGLSYNVFKNP